MAPQLFLVESFLWAADLLLGAGPGAIARLADGTMCTKNACPCAPVPLHLEETLSGVPKLSPRVPSLENTCFSGCHSMFYFWIRHLRACQLGYMLVHLSLWIYLYFQGLGGKRALQFYSYIQQKFVSKSSSMCLSSTWTVLLGASSDQAGLGLQGVSICVSGSGECQ